MRRLLWPLVALVLVLLIGDVAAASVEDRRAARTIQSADHLQRAPYVHVDGFPFVPQLVIGHYRHITVRAGQMEVPQGTNQLNFHSIVMEFHGVHASDGFRRFRADSASGTARLGYRGLSAALGARLRFAGHGEVEVVQPITVGGRTLHPRVLASPELQKGRLVFLDPVIGSAAGVPQSVQTSLERILAPGLALEHLPFDAAVSKLAPGKHSLLLGLSGTDLGYRS